MASIINYMWSTFKFIILSNCVDTHPNVRQVVGAGCAGLGHVVPAVEVVSPDLGVLHVDGVPVVVEGGGLQDDAGRAHQHRHREDPQEQPVQHHRHVLPVLQNLSKTE